ncbi:tripartite tricarboxylate transporter permease [Rhizobium sp. FKY42]|uniref:tripartite tricarboxylate transporter permease n=1 Tax=Rhizobium sp. FKY42 TaxID=2562310 RepID=UPI001FEF0525|nr:tripartite tricarboxylate transporter permease [Rhizobium sp. FKY42]
MRAANTKGSSGVGPVATIAILLPVILSLDPTGSLIMLAGIYYGAQYGGSTTAILVNISGEATTVVTAIDGHKMAQNGQAGLALRLVLAVVLARGSLVKAISMIIVGVLLSCVGSDMETGRERITFGLEVFQDGIEFVVLAMGVFGFGEIFKNLTDPEARDVVRSKIGRLWSTLKELRENLPPILRGTALDSVLGVLPGNGAIPGPFASYAVERRISKRPQDFGNGASAAVAGPVSANNAGAQTSFIPLLTLGLPPKAVVALMVGAMMIQGIVPGPQVMFAALFGFVGYALHRLDFEAAPLALGFVLGRLLEEKLRQALIISDGNPLIFVQSPLSALLLAIGMIALVTAVSPSMQKNREDVFKEA